MPAFFISMAYRKDVMQKQGFRSMKQYFQFARSVGKKIDFNRRVNALAKFYQVSALGPVIEKQLNAEENPDDPVQMIRSYLYALERSYEDLSLAGIIAQNIRPTTQKSFFRYGDRNALSPTISRHYLDDQEGTPLDVQAQNLSISYEREINPEDLVDFILTYENPKSYQSEVEQEMNALESRFKTITGITLHPDFALQFDQEFIMQNPEESAIKAPF